MPVDVDFHAGKQSEGTERDLQQVIDTTVAAGQRLASWPSERILDLLDRFSQRLLSRDNDLRLRYPTSGVPFVAQWCRRKHLESIVNLAFEDSRVLDEYVELRGRTDRRMRAFPRGLIVHWMAGNVPTLGFLSLVQGMLTKNANIIKVASSSDRFLADLLDNLCQIEPDADDGGRALCESIAVIRYDRAEKQNGELLSGSADARIFWGSDESVTEIRKFPAKVSIQDIVFPSKVSIMLVGREMLAGDLSGMVRRAASDISTFEQKACASPHTIFLETVDDEQLSHFAEELKGALEQALKTYPKTPPSSTESTAVLNLRAEYDMFHRAWYSGGIEYTILSDDEFQIGPAIGNRTIFVRKTPNLDRVSELITPKVQTIGLAVDAKRLDELTTLLGSRGVQRFTRIGTMTHFEVPWDGYLIPQLLVRWASRSRFDDEP